ncbi:MAG: hypothetical protein ACKOK8_11220, partial [Planctomycetia bacterium]
NLLAARDPVGPTRPEWRPPREVVPADPEAIYPEYLAVQDPAAHVAGHVVEWLTDPAVRESVVARLDALADRVARGGSADRAAEAVLAIAAQGTSARGACPPGTARGPLAAAAPCRPPAQAA